MNAPITPEESSTLEAILSRIPDAIVPSADLLAEYVATIPDGTPPQIVSLLRRTFVAGALSHMEQVRLALHLPELANGDPTPLLDAIGALGCGAQTLLEDESRRIMEGRDRPANRPAIIVPGSLMQ